MPKKKWLITIHSQKGGVGKTLLGFYLARRIAEKGRAGDPAVQGKEGMNTRTVLIDADLTGTSLAHALTLQAPNPTVLPLRRHTVEKTNQLLRELSEDHRDKTAIANHGPRKIALLNDALFCDPLTLRGLLSGSRKPRGNDPAKREFHLSDLLWSIYTGESEEAEMKRRPAEPANGTQQQKPKSTQVANLNNLRIVPSSGYTRHIRHSMPHIYREDVTVFLESRLAELVWWLWHKPKPQPFDVVVIDSPPVLWGLSRAVFRLHGNLRKRFDDSEQATSPAVSNLIGHLALMVSTVDVQDIVGLLHGLDSFAKKGWIGVPAAGSGKKTGIPPLLLQDIRLVLNRIPTSHKPGMEHAKMKNHIIECAEKYLDFKNDPYKSLDTRLTTLFPDGDSMVEFDHDCAEMFSKERIVLRPIDALERLYGMIKGKIEDK